MKIIKVHKWIKPILVLAIFIQLFRMIFAQSNFKGPRRWWNSFKLASIIAVSTLGVRPTPNNSNYRTIKAPIDYTTRASNDDRFKTYQERLSYGQGIQFLVKR